jgi:endonuclease/exonuclease/phosphatase family metal-dependent hydrolase
MTLRKNFVRAALFFSVLIFSPAAAGAEELKVATFNIQVFGQTKVNKAPIRDYLATVVRHFDIVAVEEIKDASGQTPGLFVTAVNATGRHYAFLLSDRTGRQPDDQSSQEQYAFYYDTDRIEALDQGALFNDSAQDLFQREPYTARFAVKGTPFTFSVTAIHTRPESAVAEIGALYTVYQDLAQRYPDESHHLILGDFNAGCTYATPSDLDALQIRGPEFHWIVPDSADTNVNPGSACAYDRLVASSSLLSHFKLWGIANWFTDKKISDHWPVWVTYDTAEP